MTSVDAERDEVKVLNDHGCLTLEAMCFTTQLQTEHRAVVERHVRSCAVCAQQQTDLAKVTERVRSARPRVPVPVEAKTLARQVVMRILAARRTHRKRANRTHTDLTMLPRSPIILGVIPS